jgi:hypothetical protein
VEARFSAPVHTGPGVDPLSCTMGIGSFPGVKSGRSVRLTPHLLLVPWSRNSIAITLLPLWAVQPVQSLSACTRVTFTLPSLKNKIGTKLEAHFSTVHLYIHPSISQSIHPSVHLSTYEYLSIHSVTHPYLPINYHLLLLLLLLLLLDAHFPTLHPSIRPTTYLSIHSATY